MAFDVQLGQGSGDSTVKEIKVAVDGRSVPEPSEDEVELASVGACFDQMSPEDQAIVLKAVGSMEEIRRNPYFNDCR